MKLYLILLLSVLQAFAQVFAQGTILFNNRSMLGVSYDAKVTLPNGRGAEGAAFTAGLFLVQGTELSLVTTSTFRSGVAAGFFFPVDGVVSGIPPLNPATFRVRVWETTAGSYENALTSGLLYGEFQTGQPDNNLFVPQLGPYPGPFGGLPDLTGIRPLTLVPEPTASALLGFGLAICYMLRRSDR